MARDRLIVAASVLLLLCTLAFGQYQIRWSTVNSGGAPGVPGIGLQYRLNGSVGQAVQWTGTGTGIDGYWGFWVPSQTDTSLGWRAKAQMPLLPSSKTMTDGGWLAYNAGDYKVYAAKGYKTGDYYAYSVKGDSWHWLASWPMGVEAKGPSKGAAAAADGDGKVYATKGNNTQGFWAYHAQGDSWSQKANVPLGPTNKKVKGGTGLVWADDAVYLLKGYKNEFWKYFPPGDSWRQLPNAPYGMNGKWDKGSWIAYDPAGSAIYAHKAKYHEFYRFEVGADSWQTAPLKAMPTINPLGKSKKSKDGGSGSVLGGAVYAFKGGNTQEFWKYYITGDSWSYRETIPQMASGSLKKKKVKGGGSLVTVATSLYAMKGNKCLELWRYVPGGSVFDATPRPLRDGVTAGQLAINGLRLAVGPNPLVSGCATLSYSLPRAGVATVSVFDVTGRSMLNRTMAAGRSGSMTLDLRHLSNGVYLVKLSSEDFTATRKLVVQH